MSCCSSSGDFRARTDDTQQFLAILDTWRRHGRITGELLAETFAELFEVARGTGRGYREFCRAIRSGVPWRDATAPGRAGFGSAMRAGAAGLLLRDSFPELLRVSVLQSCVTHSDIRSHLAAFLIASTVGWAIRSSPEALRSIEGLRGTREKTCLRMRTAIPVVLDVCAQEAAVLERPRERSQQFLESLDAITGELADCGDVDQARAALLRMVDRIAAAAAQDRLHKFPPTGTLNFALEAPIAAHATFLLFGTTFREAELEAIHLGGDTDSVGAMVGQMAGALVGFDPTWWTYTPILHESERPSFRAALRDERALASIPPEWFMKLQANFALLNIVAAAELREPVDVP